MDANKLYAAKAAHLANVREALSRAMTELDEVYGLEAEAPCQEDCDWITSISAKVSEANAEVSAMLDAVKAMLP